MMAWVRSEKRDVSVITLCIMPRNVVQLKSSCGTTNTRKTARRRRVFRKTGVGRYEGEKSEA